MINQHVIDIVSKATDPKERVLFVFNQKYGSVFALVTLQRVLRDVSRIHINFYEDEGVVWAAVPVDGFHQSEGSIRDILTRDTSILDASALWWMSDSPPVAIP